MATRFYIVVATINRRGIQVEAREPRKIRMTEAEWETFKSLLGPEWLRARIRGAQLAEKRRKNAEARERGMTE